MEEINIKIAKLIDKYLPPEGVGTERENLRMQFHIELLSIYRNIEREKNFYELALQLEEGQITEEEYHEKLFENPEKYIVDYE